MDDLDTALPELSRLIEQRIELLRNLAESLESSSLALAQNDAEAIARGAAHQAELCRQWSLLEDQLRLQFQRQCLLPGAGPSEGSSDDAPSAHLHAEWETLSARIRYLTRVHWSLLRHLERSLAIVNRVVDSCGATYTPAPRMMKTELPLRTGESSCRV